MMLSLTFLRDLVSLAAFFLLFSAPASASQHTQHQYRLDKPLSHIVPHFPGQITPYTPLLYSYESLVCRAPRRWFAWDYDEPWNNGTWSFVPMCIVSEETMTRSKRSTFCTFASRSFAEGRGIAIFTSVSHIEAISALEAFTDPESIKGANNLVDGQFGPPPYYKKYIPGMGYGIFANRTIYRGERILQETPSLVYDRAVLEELSDEDRIPMHWHLVWQLPEETRDELMDLHVQDIGDHIDDVMRTNAFGALYAENDLHNNMLPRISRHNHDCRPNSHYYFARDTMTQYVHAAKEIAPGEEIYVSYLDMEIDYSERVSATQLSWGFNCQCSICRQPYSHVRASDIRLLAIKKLKERLNDWTEDQPDRVSMALMLVELYELERLTVPIATAYEAAAYAYNVVGEKWQAAKWAAKAVETLTQFYGGSHPLTADLEQLMLDPEEHRTWLYKAPRAQRMEDGEEAELEVVDDDQA